MPRSDRKVNEGLATALSIVFFFMLTITLMFPPLSSPQDSSRSANYAAECSTAEVAYQSFHNSSIANIQSLSRNKQDIKHKESIAYWCGLTAQHLTAEASVESANSTRMAMLAAFFSVFLLMVTLLQAASMIKEAKKTSRITREVGQKQVRAYLSARIIDAEMELLGDRTTCIRVTGSAIVKNHGSSPAIDLNARIVYYFKGEPVGEGGWPLHFLETLAPDTTDSAEVIEDFYVDITSCNRWSPAVFTASIFISYLDVFGKIEEVEFFFLLYNGNIAARRIIVNADNAFNSVSSTPLEIPDVNWRTAGKKRHEESQVRRREPR